VRRNSQFKGDRNVQVKEALNHTNHTAWKNQPICVLSNQTLVALYQTAEEEPRGPAGRRPVISYNLRNCPSYYLNTFDIPVISCL
jgi:hypothetical protein